jgi:hypothetical protein
VTERDQVEEKIGRVAYQIATHNALRLATEEKLRALNDQMRALSERHQKLTAPEAQKEEGHG